jgi:hypothetical protein
MFRQHRHCVAAGLAARSVYFSVVMIGSIKQANVGVTKEVSTSKVDSFVGSAFTNWPPVALCPPACTAGKVTEPILLDLTSVIADNVLVGDETP